MPNSLRCKIKHLCHNGTLTERERDRILKALEQEPCEDAISRQAVIDIAKSSKSNWIDNSVLFKRVNDLTSVTPQPKIGHCKDCKWWKNSDGVFRRNIGAESQCPINRIEVYEGNGYCYMFEPQSRERED